LITGDQKYGKIDPKNDPQPFEEEELSSYYQKSIDGIFNTEEGERIKELHSVNESFFLVTTSNSLFGWGWNEHGNLGLGTTKDILEPTFITKSCKIAANGAYTILKCINF
jgi:alpha-tubulin suppressor-like RCC1 family protein